VIDGVLKCVVEVPAHLGAKQVGVGVQRDRTGSRGLPAKRERVCTISGVLREKTYRNRAAGQAGKCHRDVRSSEGSEGLRKEL